MPGHSNLPPARHGSALGSWKEDQEFEVILNSVVSLRLISEHRERPCSPQNNKTLHSGGRDRTTINLRLHKRQRLNQDPVAKVGGGGIYIHDSGRATTQARSPGSQQICHLTGPKPYFQPDPNHMYHTNHLVQATFCRVYYSPIPQIRKPRPGVVK